MYFPFRKRGEVNWELATFSALTGVLAEVPFDKAKGFMFKKAHASQKDALKSSIKFSLFRVPIGDEVSSSMIVIVLDL